MNDFPRFCSRCGAVLEQRFCDGRERPVCGACGLIVYRNPVPSVAVIVCQQGHVLLVKRNVEPGRNLWCLPGGFIECDETAEDAVVREVAEETGLCCRPVALLDAASVLRGFYGHVLVLCYAAEILHGTLQPGGDAAEASFFAPNALPEFAFDVHRSFVEKTLLCTRM